MTYKVIGISGRPIKGGNTDTMLSTINYERGFRKRSWN